MEEISALESLLRNEAQKSSAFATIITTMLGLERHGTPCMRCALRFAGVWDGQIYRASCVKLAAALSRVLSRPVSISDPDGAPCPLCLGTLEGGGEEPLTKRFVDMTIEATRTRGYQLQGASLSLSLALPYCMAFRDIACWECVKERAPEVARSTGNRFCEVKDALKVAVELPLAQALGLPVDVTTGTFKVTLSVTHVTVDLADFESGIKSLLPEQSLGQGSKRSRKRRRMEGQGQGRGAPPETAEEHKCTKPMIDRIQALADSEPGASTLATWFRDRSAVPSRAACSVKLAREPLFLKARYQKLSRQLPQSAWVVNGTRMGKGSVEEIVGDPIKEWCGGESGGFMGAGREDMDVRMLGTGRPFLLQINDPRRVPTPAELPLLEKLVNESEQGQDVIITQLTVSDKAQIKAMHEAAEDKQKFYTCIVWLSRPFHDFEADVAAKLQPLKDLTIQQRTPVRVLHRRSPLVRPRVIHEIRCEPINSRFFVLHVRSSAGTYIKEFVHGDLGRTEPNVGSLLGCRADILQLDVTDVIHKGEKR